MIYYNDYHDNNTIYIIALSVQVLNAEGTGEQGCGLQRPAGRMSISLQHQAGRRLLVGADGLTFQVCGLQRKQ